MCLRLPRVLIAKDGAKQSTNHPHAAKSISTHNLQLFCQYRDEIYHDGLSQVI